MIFEPLIETFEAIRMRIEKHGVALKENETRTRQILIDPLLKVLGWDIENPNQVMLEANASGLGRADYLLKYNDKSVALIEAKKLGTTLGMNEINQCLNYAHQEGIEYVIISNGSEWKMFALMKSGTLEEKIIMNLDIINKPVYENVLQSLCLWRPNLSESKLPMETVFPVFWEKQNTEVPESIETIHNDSKNTTWKNISEIYFDSNHEKPNAIRVNGGEVIAIKNRSWSGMYVQFATHLFETGRLSKDDCPIKLTRNGNRRDIHLQPEHKNEKPFTAPRKITDELWIEVHHSGAQIFQKIRQLGQRANIAPEKIELGYTQEK